MVDRTKILLVDDDALVRRSLRAALRRFARCDVADFGDGASALQHAEANPVDLAVVDLLMPGMGGPEVSRRLRGLQPGLPILILTGAAGLVTEDLGEGPSEVLAKPIDLDELVDRIEGLMARSDP